ncbi:hypothetical protein O181_066058 [Austropuccinia psidii MF-1]|uniref:Uncharacterized protein n=1 Tax=Austropuccinia psidii MF-1 TaxID=1389203 RepID=A0A9Q3I379_9BASI|nr:hypothetical protein [Austropuccinia psidii MF-1]
MAYQQGTPAQSLITDQNQSRCPTRRLKRCIKDHINPKTPENPLYMEDEQQNLEYGSIMGRTLRRRPSRIKENKAAIQEIEKSWHMEEPSHIHVPQDMEVVPFSPQPSSISRPYKPRVTLSKAHQ